MKNLLILFIITLSLNHSFGQKNEISVSLNSGLFSFRGASAQSVSMINYDDRSNNGYTNNPWGSQDGLCYGLSVGAKRITKKNIIVGLDIGYENLRSKISIDKIGGYNGVSTYQYAATGQTYLNNIFINLYPSLGYRIHLKKLNFDLSGGIEVALSTSSYDKGSATAENGTTYSILRERAGEIDCDIRQRIQLSSSFDRIGIYLGYSNGMSNYLSGYIGGSTNEGFSRLIRFGMTYKLR